MQFPKFPDWLLYATVATAILLTAGAHREDAGAPPPPPPVPGEADKPLDPALPFDPGDVVALRAGDIPIATAFSVAQGGVWLTSAEAVRRCTRVVVTVAEGRGVRAKLASSGASGVAILTTRGGGRSLAIRRNGPLQSGERGFIPGFPAGPGEVSARFLGADDGALVWAETGRTEGLNGGLSHFAGAPILDEKGRVAGLILRHTPRRGTFHSTTPPTVAQAARQPRPVTVAERPVNTANYARVADELRRDLRVVELRCLKPPPLAGEGRRAAAG